MTEVAFHFNAADKWLYLCRLLRKAAQKGSRVAVSGDRSALERIDLGLWTFSPLDFVPHCSDSSSPDMLDASPIVFCESADSSPHHEVLLNLGAAVLPGFERFERLIEVVGMDDADRVDSRKRWKYYLDRGYAITRHDLAAKEMH